ncbi:hypothetical protein J6590_038801 [Homalodisca vitripennis]|nr:hypothetical protein J6590_038801 [Homalodisca vitripennis]
MSSSAPVHLPTSLLESGPMSIGKDPNDDEGAQNELFAFFNIRDTYTTKSRSIIMNYSHQQTVVGGRRQSEVKVLNRSMLADRKIASVFCPTTLPNDYETMGNASTEEKLGQSEQNLRCLSRQEVRDVEAEQTRGERIQRKGDAESASNQADNQFLPPPVPWERAVHANRSRNLSVGRSTGPGPFTLPPRVLALSLSLSVLYIVIIGRRVAVPRAGIPIHSV